MEKCTRLPLRSRSCPGSWPYSTRLRRGQRHGIFDYGLRHSQAAVVAEHRAGSGTGLNAMRRGFAEADFLQDPEDIFVYGRDVGVFQRPVTAARFAGMNGLSASANGALRRALRAFLPPDCLAIVFPPGAD